MNTPRPTPIYSFHLNLKTLVLGGLALASAPFICAKSDPPAAVGKPVGIFDGSGDVGKVGRPGKVVFDAAKQTYTISGSGANMWGTADAFQFVWKKMFGDKAGDFTFSADVEFLPPANDPKPTALHRKACLMVRQSLDAGAAYYDVAAHGDGMTALQFREAPGGESLEIRVSQAGPRRLRIERHGDTVTLFIADKAGEELRYSGASYSLKLETPFYVGLGVCSHVNENLETAVFSNVEFKAGPSADKARLYSTIETQTAWSGPSTDRYTLHTSPSFIASPVWLPDNSGIVFSNDRRLFRLPVAPSPVPETNFPLPATGQPVAIDTGGVRNVTSVNGISPDGTMIVFTVQPPGQAPAIYTVPLAGGTAARIVPNGSGAGFAPDGKTLAFSSEREGKTDIYTVAADGRGPETNLTSGTGKNHAPAYTHDGSAIYFTSDRSGTAQVWQMKPDGSAPSQVTTDDNNNWFSSVSPTDGAILFTTYPKEVAGTPANREITVKRMNASGSIDVLARILGGPGTAPSWSADGRRRVFTSYQWVYGK